MRVPINVIDLDKTLVDFDTFKILIIREIKKRNLAIFNLTILRILRLISASNFKKEIQKSIRKKHDLAFFTNYANEILQSANPEVIKLIDYYYKQGDINILLSASPDCYVSEVAKQMNWMGKGSYFLKNGEFYHMARENKINWIKKNFPEEEYEYNLAVSDSKSDIGVFIPFKNRVLWGK